MRLEVKKSDVSMGRMFFELWTNPKSDWVSSTNDVSRSRMALSTYFGPVD